MRNLGGVGMMTDSLCPASSSGSSAVKQASGDKPSSSTTNIPCAVSLPSLQQQLGMGQQQATLPASCEIATTVPVCQVFGCKEVLVKAYCLKKRACTAHMQAEAVQLTAEDKFYRFCQQCGKFEHVSKFDNKKRSCRARLAKRRSGTRAQLIKRGCSSSTSVSPPISRSTSNAAAEIAAAIRVAPDLQTPCAAAAADDTLSLCSDWAEQQLIERSSHSASIPMPAGSLVELQQQLQPGTVRFEDTAAQHCGDWGFRDCCEQDTATAAVCGTSVQSLSDSVAASGQAMAVAAARQVHSAPLMRLPGSYDSGFGTAAVFDDITLEHASVAQMLELDDLHQDTLEHMTEADLIAALKQELETDSAAWQREQQQPPVPQQLLHSIRAPAAAPSCSAAITAVFNAAAQGASTPAAGAPPALTSKSHLSSQGQVSGGPGGTASGNPTGRGPEASGCSVPLANLQLESGRLHSFSYASAPLPQLPCETSVAGLGAGVRSSSNLLLQQQRQQVSLMDPVLMCQPCSKSTRLQWLVQQVQAELQHCDTEDLSALNEAELATLLHAVLAPASGPDGSDNSQGAAGGGGGVGSTGTTPEPSGGTVFGTISKGPGSTAADAAAAAAAQAAFASPASQPRSLLQRKQQQHSLVGSQHLASTASPMRLTHDFLISLDRTGSSKSLSSTATFDSPASNPASLPILYGSVVGMGNSLVRSVSSSIVLQQQAPELYPGQQTQKQCAMLQQQQLLQVRMAQLEQSQQVAAGQLATISSAGLMPGMARKLQQLQVQEQLQRQQLALLLQRTTGVLDSLGPN